jgi:indolepyruvate ferredoxin oxidoreductase beta subunit
MANKNEFNMVIFGTGGQGLITLLQIIAEAALDQGFDVKTSELHGLSQRGGSVEVHIRFGSKIYSPLIERSKANLVLALEAQESLRGAYFANSQTAFIINKQIIPIVSSKGFSLEEISSILKKVSQKIVFSDASAICQKELGTAVVSGVYLIGLASRQKLIPLSEKAIIKAIGKVIPKQYLELNLKAFKLAEN